MPGCQPQARVNLEVADVTRDKDEVIRGGYGRDLAVNKRCSSAAAIANSFCCSLHISSTAASGLAKGRSVRVVTSPR